MNTQLNNDEFKGQVAFIGQTLGPFFLEDPVKGNAGPAFAALKDLAVAEAAAGWPFVQEAEAVRFLNLMQEGLAAGLDADELVWEYRRLFIGPAVKPAPPWGSVYTDKDCVVFGQSALALSAWMREQGIDRLQNDNAPDDHMGLMLLLMAWLAENKPELLEEYLQEHFLTWSSHFLELLARVAEQPFYQGLAQLTQASLEGIQNALNITVSYPKYYR